MSKLAHDVQIRSKTVYNYMHT